jgi:hypothetical protein
MIDADPARWFVLFLALELACARRGAKESPNEAEHADEPNVVPPQAASAAAAASTTVRAAEPSISGARPSEAVGGRWVSCYANYRATSTPERDVARLAALCGPDNGMVAVGPVVVGDAVDAAENHRLEAVAGDCFRIFAVADSFVTDLGVEVLNARGNAITWDRNGDRWPILNPDGPFCLFDAGTYTVRVRALSGKGRYALQVWRLP